MTLPVALTAVPVIVPTEIRLEPVIFPVTFNGVNTLPVKLILVVVRLPPRILPTALMLPCEVNKLPAELNVNPAEAPALPLLLYKTCVFAPGTTKLPVILPTKVPMKNPSVVILPVALIAPLALMSVKVLPPMSEPVDIKLATFALPYPPAGTGALPPPPEYRVVKLLLLTLAVLPTVYRDVLDVIDPFLT